MDDSIGKIEQDSNMREITLHVAHQIAETEEDIVFTYLYEWGHTNEFRIKKSDIRKAFENYNGMECQNQIEYKPIPKELRSTVENVEATTLRQTCRRCYFSVDIPINNDYSWRKDAYQYCPKCGVYWREREE